MCIHSGILLGNMFNVIDYTRKKKWKKTTVNVNWWANVCSRLRTNFDRMQTCICSSPRFFFLRLAVFFFFYLFYYWQQTAISKPCGYNVRCETMSVPFSLNTRRKKILNQMLFRLSLFKLYARFPIDVIIYRRKKNQFWFIEYWKTIKEK